MADPRAGVRDEPLPWSVPIYAGKGLDGLEYRHLTHIPAGGSAEALLFDVYYVEASKEEFWLVKVHSEYGDTYYPRICLRIPVGEAANLRFVVKLAGENIRKVSHAKVTLSIRSDGECIVKGLGKQYFLLDYIKKGRIRPLKPTVKVF